MKLGMTEVTADGNALSYTFAPQADLNRLLYEAEGLLETSGAQWNEMEFEPLIPARVFWTRRQICRLRAWPRLPERRKPSIRRTQE